MGLQKLLIVKGKISWYDLSRHSLCRLLLLLFPIQTTLTMISDALPTNSYIAPIASLKKNSFYFIAIPLSYLLH